MAKLAETEAVNELVKLAVAGSVLLASFVAFYAFPETSFFYRILGIVGGFLIAAGIFFSTVQGKAVYGFLGTARTELRKMVWPTKAEALQTTLIVFVVVMIVALFLWMLDRLLGWFMQWFIG